MTHLCKCEDEVASLSTLSCSNNGRERRRLCTNTIPFHITNVLLSVITSNLHVFQELPKGHRPYRRALAGSILLWKSSVLMSVSLDDCEDQSSGVYL